MAGNAVYDRLNSSTALNAKLHQGYDPGIEHKEQGNLYSSVQFNQQQTAEVPVLEQIADGFAGALRSIADNVSNIFNGNPFNATDNNASLPPLLNTQAGPVDSGAVNPERLANFGADADLSAPALGALGDSAGPLALTAAAGNVAIGGAQVSLVSGGGDNPVPPIPDPGPNPPPIDEPQVPIISAPPSVGYEDQPVALNIALIADPDSTTSVIISGVPNGASLSAGIDNHDGSWTLTVAQLSGLTLMPPHNTSGALSLNIIAISTEDGISVSATTNLSVTVHGIADTPTLAVQNASGNEDMAIALNISAALTDTDGSENLSIIISGVPNGATLSAGIDNHNGTWTLTSAQLATLTFTPPAHTSGNFDLSVTAISSEEGTTASAHADLIVSVSGQVEQPNLSVIAAAGDEDTAIALQIAASVNDVSENLSVVIAGVPVGATLSAGIDNHDGTWTLTGAQLSGLTITPPHNSDADFHLTVTAIADENGHRAMTSLDLPVTVNGVADMPDLSVQNASGNEDTAISLNISAALTDTDGSEILSIVISGVPNGAVLSAGIDNHNGTWTLTPAQLNGLTITPPDHFSGNISLNVAATASEDGTYATANAALNVTVNGEASPPLLSVTAASGNEDTAISLNISAALSDTDGSENMSIIISGVPNGATLSAGIDNHDGSWTLTAAQLAGLSITPPHNSDVDFTLHVTAVSSENGTTSSTSADLAVNVNGVADMPTLSVQNASGNENSAIVLNIAAALTDTDGSEVLTVDIGNVPAGAILSAGIYSGNGHWSLSAADLAGLTIMPPQGYEGTINLIVTATSTEDNGDTASTSASNLSVIVNPVVHMPDITVTGAVGDEDTAIALNISLAPHGSDVMSIVISGVPGGAVLSAGIDNHNGTWTLTEAQLNGLTITPPHNSDADFDLTVTATATASNNTTAMDSVPLHVVVNAVADVPNVVAQDSSGLIDTHVAININGSLNDTDGSESITYVIAGVPDGFSFNHGSNNGNNKWTFTQSELAGLTLTTPYHWQGTLHLTAYSVSHEAENGSVALSNGDPFTVTVGDPLLGVNIDLGLGIGLGGIGVGTGVGIGVTVPNILDPAGIVIMEDSPLLLNGLTSLVTTLLSPLQQLSLGSITIGGLPAGASLSDGINLGNGTYQLTTAQLNNLYLIAPPNSDQDFTLQVDAHLLSLLTVSLATTVVHVVGVADVPTLTVAPVSALEGDALIPLNITSALTDTDGSETLSITISNLPAGFSYNMGINNADGTWTIPVTQLSNLALIAPAHWSGDLTYTVTATSTEREGDSSNHTVTGQIHVGAVTDTPVVAPPENSGQEGQPVALHLGITLGDNDGSEHLASVMIGGLQPGFSLSHGADNHDGTWTINPADLGDLQLIAPNHWSGDAHLTVTATSAENLTGIQVSATGSLNLHIEAHADTPTLTVQNESGNDASPIALHISAGLVDTDGSEKLSIVISGMPDGVTLSAGQHNNDGSWSLSQGDLSHLTINTNQDFSGDLHLTATAVAQEQSNGDTAMNTQHFTVHVDHAVDHTFHG